MTDQYLLELSTNVSPVKLFMVDGKEYELYAFEHLSEPDEVKAVALFARYGNLAQQLATAPTQGKAETISQNMRSVRVAILDTLTNVPRSVLQRWPLAVATKLMEAVEAEMEADSQGASAGENEEE